MQYRISRQYQRGGESYFAEFEDRTEAEYFIQTKLEADQRLKVQVLYRLYQGAVLLETFDADNNGDSGGGSHQGQTATFNPTPFNTAPRPSGMPSNWTRPDDKDEKAK